MKKIKIAQIVGKLYGGGVEKVIFNYCRVINNDQIQMDIFYDEDSTVSPPRDLIEKGIKFYKIPPYQKIWKYIPKLYFLLKNNNYDIVHSNLNTLSVFPLFVAKHAGIKCRIAHNHSVPSKNEGFRTILKYTLRRFSKLYANQYFACSEKAGRWLFGNRTYEAGKVRFIPNALFFNKFNQKISEDEKRKLNINNKSIVIGHVGRLTFAKNQLFLIDIFNEIHKKNKNSSLIIIGDGEESTAIKDKIKKLNLDNDVKLVGQSTNPEKYYSVMDVFILPSYFEGLSMATVEAQLGKVPVIVSNAVPKEANISNQFYQLSINESPKKWAEIALNVAGEKVVMSQYGKMYNIYRAKQILIDQYKNMID
ncbi:glycosyltransferase [Limosilactobacillus sp. pH52_RY]|uniref:glycosyltransferase n=1 Tax=Limosilactobacillus balticus TaxID=2759747 RepID=UPI0015FDF879|nr:glycosyltransferase [Limosilactobacillus balticus]MBB1110189.1 glycosyltransferase [Limosilactobacillus balticus]